METILTSVKENVATVTLNRPEKRNAFTNEMIQTLTIIIKQHAQNPEVKVLLLNATGDTFCAGADIQAMQQMANMSMDENYADAQQLADLLFYLYHFPKPTVVIAQGAVRGGGLGLIAACDIALCSDTASFAFSEVKIGVTPSTISPYVLTAIGERAAHYYFLTGEIFDAREALRIGLIQRVFVEADRVTETKAIIQQLLGNSSHAMKAAKELIRHVAHEKISETLSQKTAEHLSEMRVSKDAKEGFKAFLEKRKPIWSA